MSEASSLAPLLTWLLKYLSASAADSALAYSWCKVCFTAWDATLDAAGERILGYSRWPESLRLLLHALYPAYFVYSSMKRISGPEGAQKKRDVKQWATLLSAACVAVGVLGLQHGKSARQAARRAGGAGRGAGR